MTDRPSAETRSRRRSDLLSAGCLALLRFLLAVAIAAPALASNRPFVLSVPPGTERAGAFGALPEGLTSPWLTSLFDTRFYESFVDRWFNALLLLAPALALVALVLRWTATRHWRRRQGWYVAGATALAGVLAWWCAHAEPAVQYVRKVARLQQQGHAVSAVFPPIRFAPRETDASSQLLPPSREHWVGTDRAGRDVLVRLLFGMRISLTIGVVAVAIYVLLGALLGGLAGYFRGWVDAVILRVIEVVSCFPTMLLILTMIAVSHVRSIFYVMVVIGLTGWPGVARLVRGEFLRQAELDYTVAARALGLSPLRVAFRHLLPNAAGPVLVTAAFGVAGAILIESALAFLQLGDPSVASWGEVLRVGRETGETHLILAPGLLIFLTVTSMNVVAETLRENLDPRAERR